MLHVPVAGLFLLNSIPLYGCVPWNIYIYFTYIYVLYVDIFMYITHAYSNIYLYMFYKIYKNIYVYKIYFLLYWPFTRSRTCKGRKLWCKDLNCHLGLLRFTLEYLGLNPSSSFCSASWLMYTWGQQVTVQVLGLLPPIGKTQMQFLDLSFALTQC